MTTLLVTTLLLQLHVAGGQLSVSTTHSWNVLDDDKEPMPADKSSGKPRKNSALKLVPGGLQCDALGEQRCMMQRG